MPLPNPLITLPLPRLQLPPHHHRPADGAQDLEAALQLGGGEESGPTDGGPDTAALMDPFGRTVVACLAQMGVTAGSDAQWKPLNHQVRAAGGVWAGRG